MANYCSRCGAPLSGGRFCTYCGASLVESSDSANVVVSETDNPYAVGTAAPSASDASVPSSAPEIPTNVVRAFWICMKKYFSCRGRASRSEYWYFILAVGLLVILVNVVGLGALTVLDVGTLESRADRIADVTVVMLRALAFPWLSVLVRRFHDQNYGDVTASVAWAFFAFADIIRTLLQEIAKIFSLEQTVGNVDILSLGLFIILVCLGLWIFVVTIRQGVPGPNRFGEAPVRRPKR